MVKKNTPLLNNVVKKVDSIHGQTSESYLIKKEKNQERTSPVCMGYKYTIDILYRSKKLLDRE